MEPSELTEQDEGRTQTEINSESGQSDVGENDGPVAEASQGSPKGEPRFERRWSKRQSAPTAAPSSDAKSQATPDPDAGGLLEKERERSNDLYDRLQRAMADLSNYRRRAETEREEMAKFASMVLTAELLPVLDNFERALSTIPTELEQFSWLQGVVLIERHLRAILERQGVEAIEAVGEPFNPSLHEAIVEEESAEAEPGTVIGELQRGYTMHGRVLRPTLAKLAKRAEPSSQESETDPIEEAAAGRGSDEPSGVSSGSDE